MVFVDLEGFDRMAIEKLVDAEFIARLVRGSYETAIGSVDRAVSENSELFGSNDGSELRTLATYAEHVIVATVDGEFFRAKWSINEEGGIVLSDVETLDVPVYEPTSMGAQVRQESVRLASLILDGQIEEASEGLGELYRLVKSGVRLTAEGVEDLYVKQDFTEDDWFKATVSGEQMMRRYLGTDALRLEVPKPQFESIVGAKANDSDKADGYRGAVRAALTKLRERFDAMRKSLTLAREVNASGYRVRGADGFGESVSDYVDFVGGLSEALDAAIAILSDAEAVSEDGCVKCVARVHDGIASQAYEWALASAFAEKLARRFEPVAA